METKEITFEKYDKLDRINFVKNIMKIVDGHGQNISRDNALVISLDSSWGTGKTSLITMWNNMIKDDEKYSNYYSMYYNAWENDDWEDAFIPFMSCLRREYTYDEDNQLIKSFFVKSNAFAKTFAISMLKDSLVKVIGKNTAEAIGESLSKADDEDVPDDFCKDYLEYIEQKNEFCKGLECLVPPEGRLLIFIDELDRCRPDFAIRTLEMIKHFFDNKNIIFVIAVDMLQLSHSISTIYGLGMDSIGYLRRFIDMTFSIPKSNIDEYVKYKLTDILKIDMFRDVLTNRIDSIIYLYRELELSLRDIDKITSAFVSLLLFYDDEVYNHQQSIEIYLYFLIMKYKYPSIYDIIIHKKFSLEREKATEQILFLEHKFVVNGIVRKVLKSVDLIGAFAYNEDYIQNFDLFTAENRSTNLGEHIEYILEIFF